MARPEENLKLYPLSWFFSKKLIYTDAMRILVVEDEKETREFLRLGLSERGYAVETASDGAEGAYMASTNEYQLILLDKILPHKEGDQICRELRGKGITTPIIMLSVDSDTYTKVDLLNSGADDYLSKPFSFEELLARIKAVLRRPRRIEQSILKIDDLALDVGKQIAIRGKKHIYLTRKEFLLLECLMKEKGNIISRAKIMEYVWDMESDPFSNTIEAHILNLRKKIDKIKGKAPLIHTIPGRGYKIALS